MLLSTIGEKLNAQTQAINTLKVSDRTDTVTYNSNALIDMQSLNKGLLLPRLALTGVSSSLPMNDFVKGMVVYNTASAGAGSEMVAPGFYYCDGSKWVRLIPSDEISIPSEPWKDAATGSDATLNTQNIYQNAQVAIGKAGAAASSAQLEISSGDKGMLIPRLTQIQRDAIANPAQSLLIWNTDENCFNFWKSGKWKSLCGDLGEASLSITSADCASGTVNGSYKAGTVVNSANYLQITVQVIEPGSYIIEGQTGNGFFFQKSGTFTTTGAYTLQLPAIGTPTAAGTFNIPLTLNGNLFDPACSQSVTVAPADVLFSFNNSYCGAANTSAQSLTRGLASTGKTLQVKVNVINAGIFSFNTNTVYGVQYTASNVALTAGAQTVTLTANGNAPTTAGTNVTFTVTGTGLSGTTCDVPVNILETNATFTVTCSATTVAGSYKVGTATTTANYIDLSINAGTTGNWTATATSANAEFSFSGSGTISATGVQTVRLYANGATPVTAGVQTFSITINGQTCTQGITVTMTKKTILLVGGPSDAISAALNNTSNFGPAGTCKVESVSIISGGNATATQLISYINNSNVDVIIAGWSFTPGADATSVIADFIKNKKGYYFQAQAQNMGSYLTLILNKAYGTNVTFTGNDYSIYSAIMPNTDNAKLNGVFGDIRGKYIISDDYSSWIGITPGTVGTLGSLAQLPLYSGYAARNTYIYANGFFMFPDWGTLNYTSSAYGSNAPIGFSTSAYGTNNSWNGSAVVSQAIPAGQSAGWVLFGNVMDEAFKYVQQNINSAYQVSTNY